MTRKYIDISSISFNEVIVHTLPKHKKNEDDVEPRFSERMSPLTLSLKSIFKDKIVQALRSDKSLKLLYNPESSSTISTIAKEVIEELAIGKSEHFVANSKKIAKNLFDIQKGNNNEGILIIIPTKVNQSSALLLIKLEMDSGAQLVLNEKTKSFDINSIEDLMMTKKTRVYKVALLLKKSLQGVKYDALVTDNQIDMKAKVEIKSWFINDFLGCKPFKDPKVLTQNFYNYTKAFIETIDDDLKKAKYHQDLNSYIGKNIDYLNPEDFANDYLSTTAEKNSYKNYLKNKEFDFSRFQKDITQIDKKIRKMTMEFANGITISSDSGNINDKVKLEKTSEGQTKATITSKLRKIK
ncbi:nucleoid-associated protein [Niabella sp. CJ426]|uniref:nucleoid-associated protein n=1 Tax=Niabella sp. CJ426 TaxID=3393740 RepID=UPI003D068800